jgi:adenosylcobinamide kinase/adenosylcobinamide-phosphate guanylyltransferase
MTASMGSARTCFPFNSGAGRPVEHLEHVPGQMQRPDSPDDSIETPAKKSSPTFHFPPTMPTHLILGGARSGKSRHAEQLAAASGLAVHVIVTAEALDAEMAARIARHQADRPAGWTVHEAPAASPPRWRPSPRPTAAWWSTA